MPKPLLVFAMEQESQDVFAGHDVLHTGIGKVNAAYSLTRYLAQRRPTLVVNMGTAGSRKHAGGAIVNPVSFVQRDMDVTLLGFEKFQTPFSTDPVQINHGMSIEGLPQGVCGTGDSFDSSEGAGVFDVVDMEAYALALICQRESIPFLCLKYISDGANDEAGKDWQAALHDTAEKLKHALEKARL
jgi:adenosylhomocysteine nucleosidase